MFPHTGGFALHKTDRDGHPVMIERSGLHDAVNLAQKCTTEQAVDFHIRCSEFVFERLMPALTKREDRVISKITLILDCRGLGWSHFHLPALRVLLAFAQIDQDNYPERLCRAFIVNAPGVFTTIWAVLKRGLDKRVLDKVFIFGSKGYETELRRFIDPANVPAFLGGTCHCSHMPGGCVPCLRANAPPDLDRASQDVAARSVYRLDAVVTHEGSDISYAFTSKDYNIGFGIEFRARTGAP